MFNKITSVLVAGLLFCVLLPQTTFAQWLKQNFPTTVGTPHMAYPGLNKNTIGKNYLMMFSGNADGADPFAGSIEAVRTTDGGRTYRKFAGRAGSPFISSATICFSVFNVRA